MYVLFLRGSLGEQGLGSPLSVGARLARDGVLEIAIASKLSSHRDCARLEINAPVGARLARDGAFGIAIASKLGSHRLRGWDVQRFGHVLADLRAQPAFGRVVVVDAAPGHR